MWATLLAYDMPETNETDTSSKQPADLTWVEFLRERPPGRKDVVTGAIKSAPHLKGAKALMAPQIQLFCSEPTCNAIMFFTSEDSQLLSGNHATAFLTYRCRHCQKYEKIFAVAVRAKDANTTEAFKLGEVPPFGPPVPPRVLRLIQWDRDLFLSGRRSENQGLGIGAFTYYRRVVENQWTRLVDEIIKVAKTIGASQQTIDALMESQDEKQFTKAVKTLKDAFPPSLLINGHNPLLLLHNALSQGVHNLPDAECLTLATSIRVILIELAEKLGQALKDEKELTDAVSRLLQLQTEKASTQKDV